MKNIFPRVDSIDFTNDKQVSNKISSFPHIILDWVENNTNDVISIWDHHGQLLYISKTIEQLLGFSQADLGQIHWTKLVLAEDSKYISHNYQDQLNDKQVFHIRIRNQEKHYIWCEATIVKILDEEKDKVYYISISRDITDKKEIEDLMIRSEKMSIVGQLAAGIAHEIRNPLTSLKGFLQLLQAGIDEKDIYYRIMIDEIEKIDLITSELLYISKPITDYKQQESIRSMIIDVIKLLKPEANLKNIKLIHEQVDELYIYCDRTQIKQVFINIIKNAIEAMEKEGNIKIIVQSLDKKIWVDIIDEGCGIDQAIIHKLGEPFFTTKQKGTGLGLMISKQLLERHQAELKIIQNKEKGSTFRIIFPTTKEN